MEFSVVAQKCGQEELLHVQGQNRWPLCWSSREEIPHFQGKRNPSKTVGTERGHQRATDRNHNHRQQANLITWTTALSNSMKISHVMWGHPRWTGHGGEVRKNVVHWRGNGKPLPYSCFENPMNSMRRQRQDTKR